MRRLLKILGTPTARSSAFFYFGSFGLSVGRYLFHLVLLRLLLPSDYGEFLAYLSLLYLLGIPSSAVSNVVTKYVSEFRGKENHERVNLFFYYIVGKLLPITFLIGSFLIIFSVQLATMFKAHPGAFIILGLSVFLTLFGTVLRSYLVAFQRFVSQILIGGVEAIATIIIAVFLIKFGFGATGAVSSQLISSIFGTIIVFYLLSNYIFPKASNKKVSFSIKSFGGYSLVYAIGSLSLISTDVLLVRYFFSEYDSGIYSSLSILGRMIYFGLGPLIALVLPIASHRHAATKNSRNVFFKLGAVITLFGASATAVFVLFPRLIVSLLSGANYLEAVPYLPLFSIGVLLFSLNLFIISYFMAIGQPRKNLLLLVAAVAQPLLIFFAHQNIWQIVIINLAIEILLFLSLLWRLRKQQI